MDNSTCSQESQLSLWQPFFVKRTLFYMVIVKKSSPKNLSADCRSTVGQLSADSRPTVVADSWAVGQQTVGRQFVLCLRPKCWPTVGQQSADSR